MVQQGVPHVAEQLVDQQMSLSKILQYLETQSSYLVRGASDVRCTSTGRLRWIMVGFIITHDPSSCCIPTNAAGFSGVMRSVIKHAASTIGMQYDGALTTDTSVVIAAVNNTHPSAKVQAAHDHGIPVVHVQWLADTLAMRAVQPWELYCVLEYTPRPVPKPRAPPPSPQEPQSQSTRRTYSSIELETLRYNASPAVHDPRTMASVLRAARTMDEAVVRAAPSHTGMVFTSVWELWVRMLQTLKPIHSSSTVHGAMLLVSTCATKQHNAL